MPLGSDAADESAGAGNECPLQQKQAGHFHATFVNAPGESADEECGNENTEPGYSRFCGYGLQIGQNT